MIYPQGNDNLPRTHATGREREQDNSRCALQVLVPEGSVRPHVVAQGQSQDAVRQVHAAQRVLDALGLKDDDVSADHL